MVGVGHGGWGSARGQVLSYSQLEGSEQEDGWQLDRNLWVEHRKVYSWLGPLAFLNSLTLIPSLRLLSLVRVTSCTLRQRGMCHVMCRVCKTNVRY